PPHYPLPSHPFPTRRSSDLIDVRHASAGSFSFDDLASGAFGAYEQDLLLTLSHAFNYGQSRVECRQRVFEVDDMDFVAGAVDVLDRKSTRLNSSHVKISYAV